MIKDLQINIRLLQLVLKSKLNLGVCACTALHTVIPLLKFEYNPFVTIL